MPRTKLIFAAWECLRCCWAWQSRKPREPRECPKCRGRDLKAVSVRRMVRLREMYEA